MAVIVGGFGVPHTPVYPMLVKRDGRSCEIARLFDAQRTELAVARPDVIVMFDTDHLNTFFLDNLPVFSIGIDQSFRAPNDEPPDVPDYVIPSAPKFAEHIRAVGIAEGFDIGAAQRFSVDHSVTVPLHFLTPEMQIPVIPFFISGHIPPLPSAARCHALGQMVGRAIEAWPEDTRVVVMGSGSFSLDVGGPRIAAGRSDGVPDPAWCSKVIELMQQQQIDTLVKLATEHQLLKAGNVGGEILNWIAMLGAIGDRKPISLSPQLQSGHAYGVWRWN